MFHFDTSYVLGESTWRQCFLYNMLHNKIIWYKLQKSQNANIHFKWTFHHGLNVCVNDALFELEHRQTNTYIWCYSYAILHYIVKYKYRICKLNIVE